MKKFLSNKQLLLILLIPLGITLTQLSKNFSSFTENFYSSFIYKIIATILSAFTGFLPFSLAELIVVFFVLLILLYILKTLFELYKCKNKRLKTIKNFILNILATSGLIYFSFQLLWGFNYQRLTLDKILDLNVRESSTTELVSLCKSLVNTSNIKRKNINQNKYGIMELPYNKKYLLKTAHLGYDKAALQFSKLNGNYGNPKAILLSTPMCYTGITGFYFPYTNEANINMSEPDSFLPFTITHEMAHQIGFAKEDEANYLAYVACINHPDVNYQYSGTLSALSYSLSALRKSNIQKYKDLILTCSTGVINDLNYNKAFWQKYSGPVDKIENKINDTYLKSQNQKSGTKSYGEMVDLLLANYRKK
ncbi:DUF3810 domain-containing protein [Clostridium lacusfryxellense]|uniref:DUF3810 domain-containing protein n=1 Tax=Clostridium lacusfryxellense TaxID=205328 RepID=UPI001C0D0601|nr:DUF3810 domain-containing protein [Clostridium lacusfryxellense]MBU3113959.1 DUF3810 domain-containing protein [Clostridium lacusfryxellense]